MNARHDAGHTDVGLLCQQHPQDLARLTAALYAGFAGEAETRKMRSMDEKPGGC